MTTTTQEYICQKANVTRLETRGRTQMIGFEIHLVGHSKTEKSSPSSNDSVEVIDLYRPEQSETSLSIKSAYTSLTIEAVLFAHTI